MEYLRQQLSPCEVEMAVSGHHAAWIQPSSSRSGPLVRRSAHLFVGGIPFGRTLAPGAEPITNYTGCIEITELIQPSAFLLLRAIGRGSVERCRNMPRPASPTPTTVACDGAPCLNGATCRALQLRPGGAASFACDCPLYFSGRLCEQDTPVFSPYFHGDSYLELPPLSSLLQQDGATGGAPSVQGGVNAVTLYLTLKSASPHGTLLFSQERGTGERFLHVFLMDGRAMLRLRCSRTLLLTRVAAGRVSRGRLTPIVVQQVAGRVSGGCLTPIVVRQVAGRVSGGCLTPIVVRQVAGRVSADCLAPVMVQQVAGRVSGACLTPIVVRQVVGRVSEDPLTPVVVP
ncbi:protein eyes shut homolog [Brienomyrus brachyistius]|uniref:protein eyes shut homolog n=1 Tax=Brienomyrus brachyistius TaxID=42636 RepID=UPI0020B36790|nr:protein eyes shut homolog [Brienomyrus brachyistius]